MLNRIIYILFTIGTIFMFACQTAKTKPSEKHISRLKLNKDLSKMLSKNSDVKYKYLLNILDSVYQNDQKFRDVYNNKYLNENIEKQKELDSLNQIIISNILDSSGYLAIKEVGLIGYKAINLTLLHSNQSFKIKYYNLVEEAYSQKRMNSNTYACFIDKYLINQNKLQKYGTQTINYNGKIVYYPVDLSKLKYNVSQLNQKLNDVSIIDAFQPISVDSITYEKMLPTLIKLYNIDTTSKK